LGLNWISAELSWAPQSAMNSSVQADDDQIDSRLPLWLALIANALNLALTLQCFWIPADAEIRPMGWIAWIFLIGVGALLILPLVLFNLRRLRGRSWPKYAVTLALTPIPLAIFVEKLAHWIIGYRYLP
jgi:hypothetical protein